MSHAHGGAPKAPDLPIGCSAATLRFAAIPMVAIRRRQVRPALARGVEVIIWRHFPKAAVVHATEGLS